MNIEITQDNLEFLGVKQTCDSYQIDIKLNPPDPQRQLSLYIYVLVYFTNKGYFVDVWHVGERIKSCFHVNQGTIFETFVGMDNVPLYAIAAHIERHGYSLQGYDSNVAYRGFIKEVNYVS